MKCKSKNKNEKPKNITNSGSKIDMGMVGPSGLKTLAGWCKVFHHSTENLMMGDVDGTHQRDHRNDAAGAGLIFKGAPQRDDA